MIRVTARKRHKAAWVRCAACGIGIETGESYRELVAVQESDVFNASFVRLLAHEWCVRSDPRWDITTRAKLHRRALDSLAFVRQRYGLDVRPGQRCTALGEPGVVVEGDGKYVRVRVDGRRSADNYHARDIVLEAP